MKSDACCYHGTDTADYCCLCVGAPCRLATETVDDTAHDARIGREAAAHWWATYPGTEPF